MLDGLSITKNLVKINSCSVYNSFKLGIIHTTEMIRLAELDKSLGSWLQLKKSASFTMTSVEFINLDKSRLSDCKNFIPKTNKIFAFFRCHL